MGVFACPLSAEKLTLGAAIQRSLADQPSLRAESFTVDALEHQAALDGLAPAPTIGADLENFGGTGDLSGIHSAETTLRLGQVVELGGKREARLARGLAEVERQQNVRYLRQLDVAAETTRRYITLTRTQQQLALAERQLTLTRETEGAVRYRVDRGVAPEADQALAQIASVRADVALARAQSEFAGAQSALAAQWGEFEPGAIEATGDLLKLPDEPEFDALEARLANTPESTAFRLEANRIAADRAIAVAAARPDLSLSAGVRRLESLDDQGLLFSIAMPLGTRQRSSLAVARADSEQLALEARQQAAIIEVRQRLYARVQELRNARSEFQALSDRMLPAAEKALALTRAGYDNARYSVLQLTQAQAVLLQLQQERLTVAARYHQLLADIERSTAISGATP